ncbi:MAG: hypothetical protein G01um101425_6 [Candidatus Peregrinibacteria bacterium Gr01-1014_25]|nr:MAG: hypothetical protein G01um101425_6 [Candidatus Peregrinibacteria bacterium Gr01-1014_25]
MHKHHFNVGALTANAFRNTIVWALVLSMTIVACAAMLGRAARNMQAALVDKPDIAIYFLLPDEELGKTTMLRESEDGKTREYLAESKDGQLLVTLKRGQEQWYVSRTERLHE